MSTVHQAAYAHDLPILIASSGDLSLAVAYVTQKGLDEIREPLISSLEDARSVRLIVDLKSGNTDPAAVWDLRAIADQYPNLQLRTIVPGDDHGILHAKLYIAKDEETVAFVTGSGNLTRPALYENWEHGLRLEGNAQESEIAEALSYFETLWASPRCNELDDEAARLYEAYSGRLRSAQARGERRSGSAWSSLAEHLLDTGAKGWEWPSIRAAFLMGAIAARGTILPRTTSIEIALGFRASAYGNGTGMIAVRGMSYKASDVLPSIPENIAERFRQSILGVDTKINGMKITVDFTNNREAFDGIRAAYKPKTNHGNFRLPQKLRQAEEVVVAEFVRGFAVASALLTEHTSLPRNKWTGQPGQMMVWLRPTAKNQPMFSSLWNLLQDRLGIVAYKHIREDRDPHLKIRCEDFEEKIGFGIDWWDNLVRAGAEYNFERFPQYSFDV